MQAGDECGLVSLLDESFLPLFADPSRFVGLRSRLVGIFHNIGAANFMTPIGCPHNLLVQIPGSYSFMDFVKYGMFLQITQMVVNCSFCYLCVCYYDKLPGFLL